MYFFVCCSVVSIVEKTSFLRSATHSEEISHQSTIPLPVAFSSLTRAKLAFVASHEAKNLLIDRAPMVVCGGFSNAFQSRDDFLHADVHADVLFETT